MILHKIYLALHVVGFIVWCAGLFYWIRIMVYQSKANESSEEITDSSNKKTTDEDCTTVIIKQLQTMSERLYSVIIIPGMLLTWIMGIALVLNTGAYQFGWFYLKFTLVIFLTIYQFYGKTYMHIYRKRINSQNVILPSSKKMRIYNELATSLIVGIVFTVILKDFYLIAIMYSGFIIVLLAGFALYQKFTQTKKSL